MGINKSNWRERLQTWIKEQHGSAGWEMKLENFIEANFFTRDESSSIYDEGWDSGYAAAIDPDREEAVRTEAVAKYESHLTEVLEEMEKTDPIQQWLFGYIGAVMEIKDKLGIKE